MTIGHHIALADITHRPLRVYVAGAISDAPAEFSQILTSVIDALKASGYEILSFITDPTVRDVDVFKNDIKVCVKNCDFVLALTDISSTGVGIEMMFAMLYYNKPVLCLHKSKISKMVTGAVEHFPITQYWVRRYSTVDQILSVHVPEFIREIRVRAA